MPVACVCCRLGGLPLSVGQVYTIKVFSKYGAIVKISNVCREKQTDGECCSFVAPRLLGSILVVGQQPVGKQLQKPFDKLRAT